MKPVARPTHLARITGTTEHSLRASQQNGFISILVPNVSRICRTDFRTRDARMRCSVVVAWRRLRATYKKTRRRYEYGQGSCAAVTGFSVGASCMCRFTTLIRYVVVGCLLARVGALRMCATTRGGDERAMVLPAGRVWSVCRGRKRWPSLVKSFRMSVQDLTVGISLLGFLSAEPPLQTQGEQGPRPGTLP